LFLIEILLYIVLFVRDLYVITGTHRLFKSLAATSKFLAPEGPHEQVPFRESTDIKHRCMRYIRPGDLQSGFCAPLFYDTCLGCC